MAASGMAGSGWAADRLSRARADCLVGSVRWALRPALSRLLADGTFRPLPLRSARSRRDGSAPEVPPRDDRDGSRPAERADSPRADRDDSPRADRDGSRPAERAESPRADRDDSLRADRDDSLRADRDESRPAERADSPRADRDGSRPAERADSARDGLLGVRSLRLGSRGICASRSTGKLGNKENEGHSANRTTLVPDCVRRRPTLPRSGPRSTIGAERLSFRVRDGTGRFPLAMVAETLWRYLSLALAGADRTSGTAQWTRARMRREAAFEKVCGKSSAY